MFAAAIKETDVTALTEKITAAISGEGIEVCPGGCCGARFGGDTLLVQSPQFYRDIADTVQKVMVARITDVTVLRAVNALLLATVRVR